MRILALDLATNVGWCSGAVDAAPRFGTFKLPSTGEDIGRFAKAFDEWLRALVAVETPDRIVFEAPILRVGKTSIDTARKLGGLAWHVEFICADLSIRCNEAHIGQIKQFFAGHGRASKDDMIFVARKYGFDVRSEHEADACGVWAQAVHLTAPEHAQRFQLGMMGAK